MPASPTDGICNLTQEDGVGLFVLEDSSGALLLEFCDEPVAGGIGRITHHARRLRYDPAEKTPRQFSRQLWEEALAAEEAARSRADKLEAEGKLAEAQALEDAAAEADKALFEAELADYRVNRQLQELKTALNNAQKIGADIEQMRLAQAKALAMQKYIEDMINDEEEVVLLIS